MTIYRVKHNQNYTVVNNTICKDNRLSFKAKGIWLYAFSRPDDWQFYIEDLIRQGTDRDTAVNSGLKELEDCGYLVRIRERDEKGRWGDAQWTFFETPQPREKPSDNECEPKPDFPNQVNPKQEDQALPSTDSLLCTEEQQTTPVLSVVPLEKEKKRKLLQDYFSGIAVDLLEDYPIERIESAIAALIQAEQRVDIPNKPGWLRNAIVEGWKPSKTKADVAKEIETEEQRKTQKIIGIRAVAGRLQEINEPNFTETYSFKVADRIEVKTSKGFAIIDFSDDNCLKNLAHYIEKQGKI